MKTTRLQLIGAGTLLLCASALAVVTHVRPDPGLVRRQNQARQKLASRERHIDPGELLKLIHDNQVKLAIIDVRDEADYNLFHLADARRVTLEALNAGWIKDLPADSIKVVMSNDEARAEQAWTRLMIHQIPALYMLEGGVNQWLAVYGHLTPNVSRASDAFAYEFPAATGANHPAARPAIAHAPQRSFTPRVKFAKSLGKTGGGCGG